MIVRCAVVPQTPLLLPGLGLGVAELQPIRAACAAAVRWLTEPPVRDVVVVAGGADTEAWPASAVDPTPGFRGFRGAQPTARQSVLPLGLAVGRALLRDFAPTRLHAIAADASVAEAMELGDALDGDDLSALLVVGDGSARRGEKAPGYLDARATDFDAAVERALADGDAAALGKLDPVLAAELLVAGRAAWQVLAGAATGRQVRATLDYSGDPFGVWYAVARWDFDVSDL